MRSASVSVTVVSSTAAVVCIVLLNRTTPFPEKKLILPATPPHSWLLYAAKQLVPVSVFSSSCTDVIAFPNGKYKRCKHEGARSVKILINLQTRVAIHTVLLLKKRCTKSSFRNGAASFPGNNNKTPRMKDEIQFFYGLGAYYKSNFVCNFYNLYI